MNDKKAYSLREVCTLCGTTRSTLHGYDEIGLLHPSEKRGSGAYWFYDKDAIAKLTAIEVLTFVGYSRLEVKAILDSSHPEDALQAAVTKLESERKQIIAKICLLETLSKMYAPATSLDTTTNFMDRLHHCHDVLTSFSYETREDTEAFSLAFLQTLRRENHS